MFKEIKYDVENFTTKRDKGKYDPEFAAIHEFNCSDKTNVLFTYDNNRDAVNAVNVIRRYLRNARINLKVGIVNFVNVVIERCE